MQDFLKKEYIDIPEGYDEESGDFTFYWSLMCDPEWDSSKFDINQLFILDEGPVRVAITDDTIIDFFGPVTLMDFIKGVNNGLNREENETGHDLMDMLGDHHFPEYLKRVSDRYYVLHYGS